MKKMVYSRKPTFERSFATHPKQEYWSSKNNGTPRDYFLKSGKKCIFDCPCGNEYLAVLNNVARGKWCRHHFGIHEMAKYWSPKNDGTPEDYALHSRKKCIFDCWCGNEYEQRLDSVASGTWCPCRNNPTSKKCAQFLRETFPTVETEITLPGTSRRMDFRVLYRIFIELDGLQHFKVVKGWKTCMPPAEQLANDCNKMNRAFDMNHHVIRLLTKDVRENRFDWKSYICSAVDGLKKEQQPRLVLPMQECYNKMGLVFEKKLVVLPMSSKKHSFV